MFSPRVAGYANVRDPQQNSQLYPSVPVSVGNPDLQPEEADAKTLGIVYRPEFLPEFFVSVDYYNIEIAGQIGSLGFQRIVDLCTAGTQQYYDLIHRGTNGFITTIDTPLFNLSKFEASGVDFEMGYSTLLDLCTDRQFATSPTNERLFTRVGRLYKGYIRGSLGFFAIARGCRSSNF